MSITPSNFESSSNIYTIASNNEISESTSKSKTPQNHQSIYNIGAISNSSPSVSKSYLVPTKIPKSVIIPPPTIYLLEGEWGYIRLDNSNPSYYIVVEIIDSYNEPKRTEIVSTYVIDVTAIDKTTGKEIEFTDNAEICMKVDDTDKKKDSCLGYYAEDDVEWKCEDECLKKESSFLCGDTNHFTNFAVLLGGIPGTGNHCSSQNYFIFDKMWKDLVLISGIICLMCLLGTFLFLFSTTPFGRDIIYGLEGSRIKQVRSARTRFSTNVSEEALLEEGIKK